MRTIVSFHDLGKVDLEKGAIYEGGNSSISLKNDPLSQLFKLPGFKRGIGNMSGFRKSNKELNGKSTKEHAFVILKDTQQKKKWPNQYLKDTETYVYYGDNEDPSKHYLDTKQKGNLFLEEVFNNAYGSEENRRKIPPIFIFQSTGVNSDVEFIGLAVPGIKGEDMAQSLQLKTFTDESESFDNLIAHFTILETPFISREWLRDLKDASRDDFANAPEEWRKFIKEGINSVDLPERFNIEGKPIFITEHEKEYAVRVRKTQQIFRNKLLAYESACKICGLQIQELLVASHIKPWKVSKNIEKLDEYNGFLLCPMHDALFDKGFISFANDGKIMISGKISTEDYNKLLIYSDIVIDLEEKHIPYLEWHRDKVFKGKE